MKLVLSSIFEYGKYFADFKLIRDNASRKGDIAHLREGRCQEVNR